MFIVAIMDFVRHDFVQLYQNQPEKMALKNRCRPTDTITQNEAKPSVVADIMFNIDRKSCCGSSASNGGTAPLQPGGRQSMVLFFLPWKWRECYERR